MEHENTYFPDFLLSCDPNQLWQQPTADDEESKLFLERSSPSYSYSSDASTAATNGSEEQTIWDPQQATPNLYVKFPLPGEMEVEFRNTKIGRPKIDRANTSCSCCGAKQTPQWRYISKDPSEWIKTNGSRRSRKRTARSSVTTTKSDENDGRLCLCNACWLRVQKKSKRLRMELNHHHTDNNINTPHCFQLEESCVQPQCVQQLPPEALAIPCEAENTSPGMLDASFSQRIVNTDLINNDTAVPAVNDVKEEWLFETPSSLPVAPQEEESSSFMGDLFSQSNIGEAFQELETITMPSCCGTTTSATAADAAAASSIANWDSLLGHW